MRVNTQIRTLVAAAAILGAIAGTDARAQTISPPVAAGASPFAIAVNPITNKVYVTNEADNTLTVMDGSSLATTTLPIGARPLWLGVNPETNRIYVAQFGNNANAPHLVAVNGATSTVSSNITVGDVGWIAVNPVTNKTYTIRYGHTDEYTVTQGETFLLSESTRAFTPVGNVIDPKTNILYTIDTEVPQLVPIDVTNDAFYPTRLCPDGNGGILPNPVPADTNNPAEPTCIALTGTPVGVTVNPATGRAYTISTASSNQIAAVRALSETNPMTATFITPAGVTGTARAIAVNPVTNRIYAAFSDKIVVVNGADNTVLAVIASGVNGGPVAVGINTMTNKIYVPNDDGSLTLIDGATNATQNLAIPTGAKGVAVNPLTNSVFVLSASGITRITGANGETIQTIPLTTSIAHVANDTTATSGSFSISASASGGFLAARKVYYQIDGTNGTWSAASGSGPFSASFSGLSLGQHTIYAFATDALDATSIMNDMQSNPIVGNLTSYTFTVDNSVPPPAKAMTRVDFNGDGKTDFILQGNDGSYKIVLMDGFTAGASATVIPGGQGFTLLRTGDFDGDKKTDLVVENADTSVSIWLMDGLTVKSKTLVMPAGTGWLVTQVGDFNGDGMSDLVWSNSNGAVGVWCMNGASQITRATMLQANNQGYKVINVGDFDGDGKDDLLWSRPDGYFSIWLMDGSTIKTHGPIMQPQPYWSAVRVGDFDGDGKSDIVWMNLMDHSSSFWLMDGMSIKQRSSIMPANNVSWAPMRVGDFNHDGRSDMIWQAANGAVGLWLMNGLTIQERKTELPAGNGLVPALLGDLNADGTPEILFTDSSNTVTMWSMNGTSNSASGTYTPPAGYQLWTGSDINR